jgi:hypothetical protein
MKKLIKLLTIIIVIGYLYSPFSILYSHKALAQQQTLRVSPVIINVTLSPGKTHTHEVTIENLSNAPVPLRASLSDFMTSGEEGGYIFEETKDNPLLDWIQLDENEFILNPKEKKTLRMKIVTPNSIQVGGYYGVLFFEPVAQADQSAITKVNAKIGVLMLANIGIPDPNAKHAEILAFETEMLNSSGTVPFLLRVKNVSLNFFSAKPHLTVTPLISLGSEPKQFDLEEKTIFPGNIRRWTENTTVENLPPNIYKAQISVSSGNGQVVTAEKYIVVLPLVPAGIIAATILFVLFLIVKRKRLGKTAKAIFRP